MNTTPICPRCGKPLAAGAPLGLCPACLMQGAFPTGVDSGADLGGKTPRFTPPTVAELAPQFPQLEILEFIGQGGMGAVYKARQKELDRIVALKILPPGIGHDAAFAERFTREARALAKLNHPGIVTIHDFGRVDYAAGSTPDASRLYYFLMEFVDGVNLRQLLSASRVSTREALAIVPQICDALQFAHDQGIVHRDIKPENILLDRRGRVKVADFGLAKIMGAPLTSPSDTLAPIGGEGRGEGATVLTDASKVMGTPQYMSPEQIQAPGEVDHRADIYALGVVFYQMLTGELPGKKLEAPSSKVQIDVRLDAIVLRALEKNPNLRYQQVSQVKTMVETIVSTPPSSSRRESAQTEKPEIISRFSRMAIVGACWLIPFAAYACVVIMSRTTSLSIRDSSTFYWYLSFFQQPIFAFSAPFATTILGWVAVTQIRRSAGKLRGLWLAVFDGLFFPLLALDVAIWLFVGKLGPAKPPQYGTDIGTFLAEFFAGHNFVIPLFVCLAIDFFIIRAVWRKLNKSSASIQPPEPVYKKHHGWPINWWMLLLPVLAVSVGLAIKSIDYRYGPPAKKFTQLEPSEEKRLCDYVEKHLRLASYQWRTTGIAYDHSRPGKICCFIINLEKLEKRGDATTITMVTLTGTVNLDQSSDGSWLAQGEGPLSNLTFTIPAAKSETSAAPKLAFGPVIERVVGDMNDETNNLLNLASGRVYSFPVSIVDSRGSEAITWYRINRIDVIGKTETSLLRGLDMIVHQTPNAWWDKITTEQLDTLLAQSKNEQAKSEVLQGFAGGSTFFFKTREGCVGLLQTPQFFRSPRGVKLRYKLVQNKPESAANPFLVKTCVATSTTDLHWGKDTAITGGWKTADGNRVFFIASVIQLQTTNHIPMSAIIAKFLHVTEEAGQGLGLAGFYSDNPKLFNTDKLTLGQRDAISEAIKNSAGVTIWDDANSELNDGQTSNNSSMKENTAANGEKYLTGWSVDYIPNISKDGKTVRLVMVVQLNDPSSAQK